MAETAFTPFDADAGLILATRLPGDPTDFTTGRRSWPDLAPPSEAPPLWVHLDRTKDRAKKWFHDESGLDALAADALLDEETRPGAQTIDNGLMVILRGVNLNPGAEPDELITIRMWLEPTRIITLRQFRFQTIASLRALAQGGAAPRTPGAFLAAVADGLTDRLGEVVENLADLLDDIEESMLQRDADDSGTRARLASIRRQAITLRRFLVPQRDALQALAAMQSALLSARDQSMLRFSAEQTARVAEALEEVRDRAAVTSDEVRARHEARIGKTLYLLTIVATIMLPLGFITGLLGINVGGLPLADSPWGFAIVCIALVAMGVAEIVWFRRMRWL
ncbi:MAG: zinc transporter ZntB [Phycisphaerales bacterium]